jgi:tetrahydromethanopterin S-methyltransferase subunit G
LSPPPDQRPVPARAATAPPKAVQDALASVARQGFYLGRKVGMRRGLTHGLAVGFTLGILVAMVIRWLAFR